MDTSWEPQVWHLPRERSRAQDCCQGGAALACQWLLSARHLRLRSVARTGRPWPRPWPLRRALRRPSPLRSQRTRSRRSAPHRLSPCRRPAPLSSTGRCTSLSRPTRSGSQRHTKPTHRRPWSLSWPRSGAPGSQGTPRAALRRTRWRAALAGPQRRAAGAHLVRLRLG